MTEQYYLNFKANGTDDDQTVTNHGSAGGTCRTGHGTNPTWTDVNMVSDQSNGYPKCGRFNGSDYAMCIGTSGVANLTNLTFITGFHYYGANSSGHFACLWDKGMGAFGVMITTSHQLQIYRLPSAGGSYIQWQSNSNAFTPGHNYYLEVEWSCASATTNSQPHVHVWLDDATSYTTWAMTKTGTATGSWYSETTYPLFLNNYGTNGACGTYIGGSYNADIDMYVVRIHDAILGIDSNSYHSTDAVRWATSTNQSITLTSIPVDVSLGGYAPPATNTTGPYPTLISRTAGTLDSFVRDDEGDLWWNNYDGSNWDGWTEFPNDIPPATDTGKYAGWRSGNTDDGYQLQQGPHYWINTAGTISSNFAGVAPSGVFIVGLIQGDVPANSTDVLLQFPGTDGNHILYSAVDTVESYLDAFDKAGTKIWIQVESADADVSSLIDIIFTRYGSHPCIIGFGLDGEWYKYSSYSDPDTPGQPFTNAEQTAWVNKLHTYNANYKLFLKHWRPEHMPTSNNTSVVYVSDNAQFADYADMMTKFETWGSTFSTRNVAFQFGYPYDEINVWSALMPDPMAQIGADLFANISNCVGVYWVDFSIMNVYIPSDSYLLPGQQVALVDGSTIHLFRTGYEGYIYTSRYAGATWTDWTSLGNACKVAGYITPSVCQAAAGALYAFAPSPSGATWYQRYSSSAWAANWTTLGGVTWDSVACFGKSTSAVYVVAPQDDGTLQERHYNGSSFTAWSNAPFGATAYVGSPVASYDGTYGQVVANDSGGVSRSYTLTGTTWSGPVNESGASTNLSMLKSGSGTTMAMARASDSKVYSMTAAGANFATWVDTGAYALTNSGSAGTVVASGVYAGLTAEVLSDDGDVWVATYASGAWGAWHDIGWGTYVSPVTVTIQNNVAVSWSGTADIIKANAVSVAGTKATTAHVSYTGNPSSIVVNGVSVAGTTIVRVSRIDQNLTAAIMDVHASDTAGTTVTYVSRVDQHLTPSSVLVNASDVSGTTATYVSHIDQRLTLDVTDVNATITSSVFHISAIKVLDTPDVNANNGTISMKGSFTGVPDAIDVNASIVTPSPHISCTKTLTSVLGGANYVTIGVNTHYVAQLPSIEVDPNIGSNPTASLGYHATTTSPYVNANNGATSVAVSRVERPNSIAVNVNGVAETTATYVSRIDQHPTLDTPDVNASALAGTTPTYISRRDQQLILDIPDVNASDVAGTTPTYVSHIGNHLTLDTPDVNASALAGTLVTYVSRIDQQLTLDVSDVNATILTPVIHVSTVKILDTPDVNAIIGTTSMVGSFIGVPDAIDVNANVTTQGIYISCTKTLASALAGANYTLLGVHIYYSAQTPCIVVQAVGGTWDLGIGHLSALSPLSAYANNGVINVSISRVERPNSIVVNVEGDAGTTATYVSRIDQNPTLDTPDVNAAALAGTTPTYVSRLDKQLTLDVNDVNATDVAGTTPTYVSHIGNHLTLDTPDVYVSNVDGTLVTYVSRIDQQLTLDTPDVNSTITTPVAHISAVKTLDIPNVNVVNGTISMVGSYTGAPDSIDVNSNITTQVIHISCTKTVSSALLGANYTVLGVHIYYSAQLPCIDVNADNEDCDLAIDHHSTPSPLSVYANNGTYGLVISCRIIQTPAAVNASGVAGTTPTSISRADYNAPMLPTLDVNTNNGVANVSVSLPLSSIGVNATATSAVQHISYTVITDVPDVNANKGSLNVARLDNNQTVISINSLVYVTAPSPIVDYTEVADVCSVNPTATTAAAHLSFASTLPSPEINVGIASPLPYISYTKTVASCLCGANYVAPSVAWTHTETLTPIAVNSVATSATPRIDYSGGLTLITVNATDIAEGIVVAARVSYAAHFSSLAANATTVNTSISRIDQNLSLSSIQVYANCGSLVEVGSFAGVVASVNVNANCVTASPLISNVTILSVNAVNARYGLIYMRGDHSATASTVSANANNGTYYIFISCSNTLSSSAVNSNATALSVLRADQNITTSVPVINAVCVTAVYKSSYNITTNSLAANAAATAASGGASFAITATPLTANAGATPLSFKSSYAVSLYSLVTDVLDYAPTITHDHNLVADSIRSNINAGVIIIAELGQLITLLTPTANLNAGTTHLTIYYFGTVNSIQAANIACVNPTTHVSFSSSISSVVTQAKAVTAAPIINCSKTINVVAANTMTTTLTPNVSYSTALATPSAYASNGTGSIRIDCSASLASPITNTSIIGVSIEAGYGLEVQLDSIYACEVLMVVTGIGYGVNLASIEVEVQCVFARSIFGPAIFKAVVIFNLPFRWETSRGNIGKSSTIHVTPPSTESVVGALLSTTGELV